MVGSNVASDPVQYHRIIQVRRDRNAGQKGPLVHLVQAPIQSTANSAAGSNFKVRAGCTGLCPAEF